MRRVSTQHKRKVNCASTARWREKMRQENPEWKVWESMKERCYRKNHIYYDNYGGKGVTVCARWLEHGKGFWNFLEDMGRRPHDKMELDRIKSNEGYCRENCRWLEQFKNRSRATGKEQYLDEPLTPAAELVDI